MKTAILDLEIVEKETGYRRALLIATATLSCVLVELNLEVVLAGQLNHLWIASQCKG